MLALRMGQSRLGTLGADFPLCGVCVHRGSRCERCNEFMPGSSSGTGRGRDGAGRRTGDCGETDPAEASAEPHVECVSFGERLVIRLVTESDAALLQRL